MKCDRFTAALPSAPGNRERADVHQGEPKDTTVYPYQIPRRTMIPYF